MVKLGLPTSTRCRCVSDRSLISVTVQILAALSLLMLPWNHSRLQLVLSGKARVTRNSHKLHTGLLNGTLVFTFRASFAQYRLALSEDDSVRPQPQIMHLQQLLSAFATVRLSTSAEPVKIEGHFPELKNKKMKGKTAAASSCNLQTLSAADCRHKGVVVHVQTCGAMWRCVVVQIGWEEL